MAVMFLASCGGGNDKKSEEKVNDDEQVEQTKEIKATLLNGDVSVEGPAGEFIEILDTEIILTKSEIGYQTKIKFKVIGQTDDWLDAMEVMFYDASGNQIMEDGYTFSCDAMTRNSLLGEINKGKGFYTVDFQNYVGSTTFDSEEVAKENMKNFESFLSEVAFFSVYAEMRSNPNQ